MKVRKNKGHRRAIRFYTACYGFREPFKILCDGTFVHHLLAHNITPADTALRNTLGGAVKIFTTRCALVELKNIAKRHLDTYSDSLDAARNLLTARCGHEKRKDAESCLTEVIGENNQEHFFVATQDAELRKKFQEIPGVPIIYARDNALIVERPSATQQKFVKAAEEKRLHLTDLEYKMLKLPKKPSATDELMDPSKADEDPGTHMLENNLNDITSKDTSQFKRKRAKGPNPLSCKKKKIKENLDAAPTKEDSSPQGDTIRRKRKKPRKRKNKSLIKALLASGEI